MCEEIVGYLEMWNGMMPPRGDVPYRSLTDAILRHARAWPVVSEAAWPRGEKQQCFSNSQRLAIAHPELTYVEGYALNVIPVHHAWCVDPDGAVIDVTWERRDSNRYFGVPIRTRYIRKISLQTGWWTALFDNWRSAPPQPILTGRHKPDVWLQPWPRLGDRS